MTPAEKGLNIAPLAGYLSTNHGEFQQTAVVSGDFNGGADFVVQALVRTTLVAPALADPWGVNASCANRTRHVSSCEIFAPA